MRVICIGAHPDDCEIEFGGTAAKFGSRGDAVKFLSVTNGEAGHHLHPGPELVKIRCAEAQEAARRLGISEAEVLRYRDGRLLPSIEAREELIRQIRAWNADVVLTHRPFDYHPDHRATGHLVQDAAYLVMLPQVCSDAPALPGNPVFLYLEDSFQRPTPFRGDIALDIGDVWERKLDALDAHRSQVYEWLPWIDAKTNDAKTNRETASDAAQVPEDPAARRQWLDASWSREISACTRAALTRRYGPEHAARVRHAEAFELSEYGRQPSAAELGEMFPR